MSAMDMYWAQPPITRTITALVVVLSVSVWIFRLLSMYDMAFLPYLIFTYKRIPQIWRLATAFLLSGPKLSLILDPYFFFTYSKKLEVDAPRFQAPGEYFTALVFICANILFLGGYILGAPTLISPLILALAYMYSVDNPEVRISFFIITMRAKYLPYCMLILTLIMAGPIEMVVDATGLVAAHLYDFLTRLWPRFGAGRNVIVPPEFVKRWFRTPGIREGYRSYGTAFEPRTTANSQPPNIGRGTPSWTDRFTTGTSAWGSHGGGRRLGGD
ncbi:Der1-like protein [Elsinoe fawcettii]|nr:Der1-like protein [Elsinoe fawcettii]